MDDIKPKFCKSCGAPRAPDAQFCGQCGTQWSKPDERPVEHTAVTEETVGGNMQFRYDVAHTGDYSPVAGSTPPNNQLKWSFVTGAPVQSSPAVANGVVYVGNNDGNIYAIDAVTGSDKWSYATGMRMQSSPAVANGAVYVGSYNKKEKFGEGKLYAFDAVTGAVKWSQLFERKGFGVKEGDRMQTSPTVAHGVVYIGDDFGYVYAFDAVTGVLKWSHRCTFMMHVLLQKGQEEFGEGPISSPAVANTTIIVVSLGGRLYALDAATGAVKWSSAFSGAVRVYSSPAVANVVVYVGGATLLSNTLHAFNVIDGAPFFLPSLKILGKMHSSPAVANSVVYVASTIRKKSMIYAIDAKTGATKWSLVIGAALHSSPSVANDVVYVGSDDGKVYAIDAKTGATKWSFVTGGPVKSSPAVVNGVVYVGSDDGKVYAIGS